MLTRKEKILLIIHGAVSHCLFILLGPFVTCLFKYKFKYEVDDLKAAREKYQDILRNKKGPVLLCTNHLTLIDSVIQTTILNSTTGYLLNFSSFPWNLPEKSNYYNKYLLRLFCYLGKCIPVQRMTGSKNTKKTMAQIQFVLARGDVISIFPEGTRSRTGIIDDQNFSYGAGEILKHSDAATVICIYLRGRKNGGFANYPTKGERFYIEIEAFSPKSEYSGLRKVKDLSIQIINKLKSMETKYFEHESASRQ
jgi:1-acyl-sn-glycerol-3-phosphate acyltransferase